MQKGRFVPVMITPFNDNGSIDFDCLTLLTEFYLDAGAKGLFANCLSSEMFELSDEERIAITDHVVKTAAGKVPVVSTGTFGKPTHQEAEFIKQIYDTGVNGAILITNMFASQHESDDLFRKKAFELFDATGDIPLGFYECPVPYKRIITPELLREFADTRRLVYQKDTCLNLKDVEQKIRLTKHTSLEIYDAYMVHAVDSLKAGSAGLSCIQGNYFPELVVWLCENFDNPLQAANVESVQQFFVDTMDVIHETYPISVKYFLQKRGFPIKINTRREVGELNAQKRNDLDFLYQSFIDIRDKLDLREPVHCSINEV